MPPDPQRIDLHHHFLPPEFIGDLGKRKIAWTGGPDVPEWSLSIAREMMGRNGIAAAVASVVPEVYWGDVESGVRWARHCNEFLAKAIEDDREHFGGFATLPLPDTDAACRELEHALDVLQLDGVILWASQGAQYLGDPAFEELFQELDHRSAVVFIHPNTTPPGSDVPKLSLPYALVEFVFDTTRCITNLLYSGALERYPSIRFIVSYAGGAVPYLAWRIQLGEMLPHLREHAPKGALHYLQRLYYDTALAANDYALGALRQFVPASQIVFGSEFPLAPEPLVRVQTGALETSKLLDAAARKAIDRESALALFPRFAGKA